MSDRLAGLTHRDADWAGLRVVVTGLGVSGFAAADALPRAAPVPSSARADALAARAAALRGSVLTEEERARLAQAPATAPALR